MGHLRQVGFLDQFPFLHVAAVHVEQVEKCVRYPRHLGSEPPTTTSIATGVKDAINTAFGGGPFTATSSGAVVTTTFTGDGTPTYTSSVTGTETLTLTGSSYGTGPALNAGAGLAGTNDIVLQTAWPSIYTTKPPYPITTTFMNWGEVFAAETSVIWVGSSPGSDTPDAYISNMGCSRQVVKTLEQLGRLSLPAEYISTRITNNHNNLCDGGEILHHFI